MEKVSNRIPSLDGLRAISIALVVFSHISHSYPIFAAINQFNIGNLGVRVFFVISGFLITGLLLKEIDKSGQINLAKFYFRRTFRIFPPYYFYLLVILSLSFVGVFEIPVKSFLAPFLYLSNYWDPNTWVLGHSWSLSVEEQFYLIFPGILFFFGIKKSAKILLIVVLLSPFIRYADYRFFEQARWQMMGFHQYMDALAIGCLLAIFYQELHENRFYKRILNSKFVILIPATVFILNSLVDRPKIYALSCSFINILIAFCIDWAVTNHQSIIGKTLNSAPMVTIGMMSYSIYLWQQPFFDENQTLIWTRFPLNFIGLAVTSCFSYYFVEKYFLKLRPTFEEKIFKPKKIELV